MNKPGIINFGLVKRFLVIAFLLIPFITKTSGANCDIVVAKDGSGGYTSISQAIASLPMYNYERIIIYVKNGVYREKIRIECDYITMIGESRDSTIIEYSSLRAEWTSAPDFIGPAVVNIHADDIILKNLTIRNTQTEIGPHAFAIYGTGTRTILINCSVISKGGDTVSLWNYKQGMYYHANCYFEGAVDFVCPRGWCYIRDSGFYELTETAALWHAAVVDPNQKFVLENCSFDGVKGFHLARHHYEAQFYFLNGNFSTNLSNSPIEHVIPIDSNNVARPYFYGDRYYFYNCHRKGGDFSWFATNTDQWPDDINPDNLDAFRTFDYKWNPENDSAVQIKNIELRRTKLYLYFDEIVGVRGGPVLQTNEGKLFQYVSGSGRNILLFQSDAAFEIAEIKSGDSLSVLAGEIYSVRASVKERKLPASIVLSKWINENISIEK